MDEHDLFLAAASAKYPHCEEAKAALRAIGIPYDDDKYGTDVSFQAALTLINRHSGGNLLALKRGIEKELGSLFGEVSALWFGIASRRLESCEELLKKYSREVESKKHKLSTARTAPALMHYQHSVKTQADRIEQYNEAPPTLKEAVTEDWAPHLAVIKKVVEDLILLEKEMNDAIVLAENESRAKSGDRRSKISLVLGIVGGGGAVGIATNWDKIEPVLNAVLSWLF